MSDVKRYEPCNESGADEDPEGEYVLHEDHEKLRAELAEARAEGVRDVETLAREVEALRAQCVLHEQGYEDEHVRCNRALETVTALKTECKRLREAAVPVLEMADAWFRSAFADSRPGDSVRKTLALASLNLLRTALAADPVSDYDDGT